MLPLLLASRYSNLFIILKCFSRCSLVIGEAGITPSSSKAVDTGKVLVNNLENNSVSIFDLIDKSSLKTTGVGTPPELV